MGKTKRLTTVHRPYPVVGLIIPWNFPFLNAGLDGVAALAAGASLLLKPSEVTPLSAVEFARGWAEIGAPPVLALVNGYAETGAAVIANSDYVHFTGSTATGRKVAVDEEEAIRLANDSSYGLSATVWTGDNARGERVARRIEAGAVNVNDALANGFSFALPMPGWKNSGIGSRSGGADGLLKYCRPQAITVPRVPTRARELLWYPYSRRKARLAAGVTQGGPWHAGCVVSG